MTKKLLVFQSDFGLSDDAVSVMCGVSYDVDSNLTISDLTYHIPQINI